MGARATKITTPAEYAPALRRALEARAPHVLDVDVNLDVEGYRAIWYKYPLSFFETWAPGPTETRA